MVSSTLSRTRRLDMDEKKKDASSEVENLEVEVLSDSDLESVSGGENNVNSNVANACCIADAN
jgi:hypothetical protein